MPAALKSRAAARAMARFADNVPAEMRFGLAPAGGGGRVAPPAPPAPVPLAPVIDAAVAAVAAAAPVTASQIPGLQGSINPSNPNDIANFINPTVDHRLDSILAKTHSPLRKGIIQQTDDVVPPGQAYPYALRFLVNPGEIDVNYSVATGVTPPGDLSPAQLAASSFYPGSTSIGFSLLFDRTYEVHYPVANGQHNIQSLGCYADIMMLEYITGVRAGVSASPTNADGSAGDPTKSQSFIGNMLFSPVYVIFGGGNGGDSQKPVVGLTYVTYITSMSVNYALFSVNMVPTRCAVNISMTQLVVGDAAATFNFQTLGGTTLDRAQSNRNALSRRGRSRAE